MEGRAVSSWAGGRGPGKMSRAEAVGEDRAGKGSVRSQGGWTRPVRRGQASESSALEGS